MVASTLLLILDSRGGSRFWLRFPQRLILSFSDLQLITGIAILIAAFSKHCLISIYHLRIVAELAWFSGNMHLASVTAPRKPFKERSTIMTCRVILMLIMFLLLTVTMLWVTFLRYGVGGCGNGSCPAECPWHDPHSFVLLYFE